MLKRLESVVTYAGMAIAAALALLTGIDVAGRYALGRPLPGAYELSEAILSSLFAFGMAACTARDEFISVDAVSSRLPRLAQRALLILASLVVAFISGALFWNGVGLGMEALEVGEKTSVLRVPLSPFRFVLAFGFLLNVVFSAGQLVKLVRGKRVDPG